MLCTGLGVGELSCTPDVLMRVVVGTGERLWVTPPLVPLPPLPAGWELLG